jgi:hypothetical protein
MVLILSYEGDPHAHAVIRELRLLGHEPYMMDLSRFPKEARLRCHYGKGATRFHYRDAVAGKLDLSSVRSVWWRRPQPYEFENDLEDTYFAANECEEALSGVWSAMDASWINPPVPDQAAHKKTYQLKLAQDLGLEIPETLVTNDPREAERFLKRVGQAIYKPFSATNDKWRETRLIGEEERRNLALIRHAPVILQEYIPGMDYRVTVVGDRVFPACLDARKANYPVDFRMNVHGVEIKAATLPAPIEKAIHKLMKRLKLVYGAIDFRFDERNERFCFLEINPAGQWLFVEETTRQPIARTLAEELIKG